MKINLEKQIKKHVYGKPHTAVVIPPPGFTETCIAEIENKISTSVSLHKFIPKVELKNNRIIISNIDYNLLCELTLRLTCAQDVRIVIHAGRTHGRKGFIRECEQAEFQYFLPMHSKIKIETNSIASKAFHEEELTTMLEEILQSQGHTTTKSITAPAFKLYALLHREMLQLELSLAGDVLSHRGYRTNLQSAAPLREDLAAAAMASTLKFAEIKSLSKVNHLLIPFSGSGTFACETIINTLELPLSIFTREFSFKQLSCFKEEKYNWLIAKLIKNSQKLLEDNAEIKISGIDISSTELGIGKNNWLYFMQHLEKASVKLNNVNCNFINQDIFKTNLNEIVEGSAIVFLPLNPPYGKRLSAAKEDTDKFFADLGALVKETSLKLIGKKQKLAGFVLCPDEHTWKIFLKMIGKMKHSTLHFTQGGLDIRLCMFKT